MIRDTQVMKLQDSFGRTITSLRISITDRCNLRCRYCMPENGVTFLPHDDILRYEEIERLIQIALQQGITKIRLTGGEPLVRKGIVGFIRRVGALSGLQTLTLTTNGILLPRYAADLREAGLNYLNISLDTLNAQKFAEMTRFDRLDLVLQGIRSAKEAGFPVIKINVVSVRGFNDDELFDFIHFADQHDLIVRFIEYMPFSGNGWQPQGFLSSRELRSTLEERYTLLPNTEHPAAAAKTYRIPGHRGRIGFISAVSEGFCARCNRLRLTSDGCLRPCLHGPIEIDVKGPLRRGASDEDLIALFHEASEKKPAAHQDFLEYGYTRAEHDRAMVGIGG